MPPPLIGFNFDFDFNVRLATAGTRKQWLPNILLKPYPGVPLVGLVCTLQRTVIMSQCLCLKDETNLGTSENKTPYSSGPAEANVYRTVILKFLLITGIGIVTKKGHMQAYMPTMYMHMHVPIHAPAKNAFSAWICPEWLLCHQLPTPPVNKKNWLDPSL